MLAEFDWPAEQPLGLKVRAEAGSGLRVLHIADSGAAIEWNRSCAGLGGDIRAGDVIFRVNGLGAEHANPLTEELGRLRGRSVVLAYRRTVPLQGVEPPRPAPPPQPAQPPPKPQPQQYQPQQPPQPQPPQQHQPPQQYQPQQQQLHQQVRQEPLPQQQPHVQPQPPMQRQAPAPPPPQHQQPVMAGDPRCVAPAAPVGAPYGAPPPQPAWSPPPSVQEFDPWDCHPWMPPPSGPARPPPPPPPATSPGGRRFNGVADSPPPRLAPQLGGGHSFTAEIMWAGDDLLGIQVMMRSGELVCTTVSETGAVPRWNRAVGPERAVRPGDVIRKANGLDLVGDQERALEVLKSARGGPVSLHILRTSAPAQL